MNKNDVKTKYKYKSCIWFYWNSSKYECNESRAKLTWRPSDATYFARHPLRSYFDECQINKIYFLIDHTYRTYMNLHIYLRCPSSISSVSTVKSVSKRQQIRNISDGVNFGEICRSSRCLVTSVGLLADRRRQLRSSLVSKYVQKYFGWISGVLLCFGTQISLNMYV